MTNVKLTDRSQMMIPSEVRQALGLRPGDQIKIDVKDGKATIEKVKGYHINRLRVYGGKTWKDSWLEIERDRDDWEAR